MLIHRIAAQLYTAEALQTVEAGLDAGEDVTLAVSQSGRTLMAAAQFARRPRPTVYIVSGEDAADRAARSLAAYVGLAHVCRFPERKDYPWREPGARRRCGGAALRGSGAHRVRGQLHHGCLGPCAAALRAAGRESLLGVHHFCGGRGDSF